jgi:hypothetical protein
MEWKDKKPSDSPRKHYGSDQPKPKDREYDQFVNKIARKVPKEEDRILLLVTMLGAAGILVDYLMTTASKNQTPPPNEVKYVCALICGNLISLTSDSEHVKSVDLGSNPYVMGEQTQEGIYRKMKWAIEELYKQIQENEKVLDNDV